MSARILLRRFVGVAVVTTVGLASAPFVGSAAAISDPTSFAPTSTVGKRPVVTATYAAAVEPNQNVSNIKVYGNGDTPAQAVAGTMTYTNGNKTMVLTLSSDLTSSKSPYTATAVATPATGSNDPVVNSKSWTFAVDSVAPVTPTVSVSPARTNGLVTVTGTTDPGATVAVDVARTAAPANKVSGSAVADGTGKYTVANLDVSAFTDGDLVATAVASDAFGNSSAAATGSAVKDTVAPVRATTFPADQRTAQTRNTVTVTFDEALRTTSSLSVKNGLGSTLAGVTSFSNGDKTMTFTADSPLTPGGGLYTITANATDVAGNAARSTSTFTIDDTAPGAPSVSLPNPVNLANKAAVAVAGTAEPGAKVDVQVDDSVPGSPVTGSGTADATSGAYSITVDLSPLADGDVQAVAIATDGAGNSGPSTTSAKSKKDTVAPAAPTVDMTSPIAATRATTVSGTTEPGFSVLVSVDDANDATTAPVKQTVTADNDGAYSVALTLTGLKDGTVTATASATDLAGNPGPGASDTATLDTGIPAKPTLSMPTVNNANKAAVAASGVAEPASVVTVTLSDGTNPVKSQNATAGSNGAYTTTFDTSDLADGTLTVTATAKDGATNTSDTATISVVRDTVAPGAPTVVLPQYVNDATKGAVEVGGTAEAGSTVALTVSDTNGTTPDVTTSVVASPTGSWTKVLNLSSLADGALAASATATDAAQNPSATAGTATSTKDVVAPAAPAVSLTDPITQANVATSAVTGTVASAATVTVSVNDTDAATAPVTGGGAVTGGSFNVPVDLSALTDGAVTATVKAQDAAGNESAPGSSPASAKDTITLARVSTIPAPAAVVQPPALISATYNEALNTTQTTVKLLDKSGASLAGTKAFANGDRTVTFDAEDTLTDAASPYTVQLSAKDADGSDPDVSTFTFSVDTTPPAAPSITLPAVVNAAGDDAVQVSGVAEKGSSVAISVDDATAGSPVTATAPADATTGAYSATLNLAGLSDGTLAAEAVATDATGNPSAPGTTTAQKDATAPAAPSVTLADFVNDATKAAVKVSGVAEKGSSVAVAVDDSVAGSPVTGTATAHATSGAYEVTLDLTSLADGALTAAATATDAALNRSTEGTAAATKDVVAPAAPSVDLADPVNGGGKTTTGVSGVAEPGARLSISVDDATAGGALAETANADATTGAYSVPFDVTDLADGTLTASVTARDAAGNASAPGTDTATKDAVVPAKPALSVPAYANLVNQGVFPVSGTTDPGTTVRITADDEFPATAPVAVTTTPDSTGAYGTVIALGTLSDGPITLRAVATDADGNVSGAGTATTTKDTIEPAQPTVTVTDPVNAANKTTATVAGITEQGVGVTVSVDDATPGDAVAATDVADENGAYGVTVDVTPLADGTIGATVQATDAAGNVSSSVTSFAKKDTLAPSAPSLSMQDGVNAAGTTTVALAGVAEPGSSVALSVDDATTGDAVTKTVTADPTSGEFTTTLDVTALADGTLTATAVATDAAGNPSAPATATAVKDAALPDVPVLTAPAAITRATRAAAPFSGTAEPGAAIAITVDDADDTTAPVTGAAVAGTDGAWALALDVTSLRDGDLSVTVTATDAFANTSATTTGIASKNVTRAFTLTFPVRKPAPGGLLVPISGRAETVEVTAHQTYVTSSPADTTFTGTPMLSSLDSRFTAGTCGAAVDGVATCTGVVFGDLGLQTLRATSGSGEDLVEGARTALVHATGLAFVNPPATAEPNVPVSFTVVPTVGVEGASTAGYSETRTLTTTGGASSPASGSALTCAQPSCTFSVTFLSRGTKTVTVTDGGYHTATTGPATVVLPYVTQLTLNRSAASVPAGGYVTLSGKLQNTQTLDGVTGRTVTILRKTAPSTTFKPYVTATTAADGTWTKRVALSRNTTYYAKFAGDAFHLASESTSKQVLAAQVVYSTWSASGRTVTVTGKVSPNAAGRQVYLQYRRSDGTWAYAGVARTVSSTGTYKLSKTFTGARVLRVGISATSVNAAGYSRTYLLR